MGNNQGQGCPQPTYEHRPCQRSCEIRTITLGCPVLRQTATAGEPELQESAPIIAPPIEQKQQPPTHTQPQIPDYSAYSTVLHPATEGELKELIPLPDEQADPIYINLQGFGPGVRLGMFKNGDYAIYIFDSSYTPDGAIKYFDIPQDKKWGLIWRVSSSSVNITVPAQAQVRQGNLLLFPDYVVQGLYKRAEDNYMVYVLFRTKDKQKRLFAVQKNALMLNEPQTEEYQESYQRFCQENIAVCHRSDTAYKTEEELKQKFLEERKTAPEAMKEQTAQVPAPAIVAAQPTTLGITKPLPEVPVPKQSVTCVGTSLEFAKGLVGDEFHF